MKNQMIAAMFIASLSTVAVSDETANSEQRASAPPALSILKSWSVNLGDHSVYFNQVAPLMVPTASPAVPGTETTTVANPRIPGKKFHTFLISATVCDHQYTELSWTEGNVLRGALSNVDFNHFSNAAQVEGPDTIYSFVFIITNCPLRTGAQSSDVPMQNRAAILARLPAQHSGYLVADDGTGSAPPAESMLGALDALHQFYEKNRQGLARAYAEGEAARIEAELKAKEAPAPRPDTVIHFWVAPGTPVFGINEVRKNQ